MSEDKPKKSWREIDAARDRASGRAPRGGEAQSQKSRRSEQASRQYKAALDALFEKGGFDKVATALGKPEAKAEAGGQAEENRLTLRRKILEAIGRDEVSRALNKYLSQYPWPDDWEVLEQGLDHKDEVRIEEALSKMDELVQRAKPRRARTLIGKLRLLEETAAVPEVRAHAGALRSELG